MSDWEKRKQAKMRLEIREDHLGDGFEVRDFEESN
jgi:hypothetical protein